MCPAKIANVPPTSVLISVGRALGAFALHRGTQPDNFVELFGLRKRLIDSLAAGLENYFLMDRFRRVRNVLVAGQLRFRSRNRKRANPLRRHGDNRLRRVLVSIALLTILIAHGCQLHRAHTWRREYQITDSLREQKAFASDRHSRWMPCSAAAVDRLRALLATVSPRSVCL